MPDLTVLPGWIITAPSGKLYAYPLPDPDEAWCAHFGPSGRTWKDLLQVQGWHMTKAMVAQERPQAAPEPQGHSLHGFALRRVGK